MSDIESRLGFKIWIAFLGTATVSCVSLALLYAVDSSYIHWLKGPRWGSFVSPHNASILLIAAAFAGSIALLIAVSLSWVVSWRKRGISPRVLAAWCLLLPASAISFVPSSHHYLAVAVFLLGPGENSDYFQTTAAVKDSTALLNALILRNVQIDEALLGLAAKFDSPSVIGRLVRYGMAVNMQSGADRATALHYAVAAKQYRSAKALLEAGARPDIADARGMTPLDAASTLRDDRMVGILKSGKGTAAAGPAGH